MATFNVHMLFDTTCDSGACAPGDFERAPTEAQLEAQVTRLAAAIASLDADVLLLQEVENDAALQALQAALGEAYGFAWVAETGRPASLDVAVLSRLPALGIRTHRDEPLLLPDGTTTTFARELPEVHLEADGHRVVAFAAHFKSKRGDDPDRRLAEAEAAARLLGEAAAARPDALVVLGGDLNDVPGSPPLSALEDGGGLIRVASDLGSAAGTYLYHQEWQAIDHLLLHPKAAGAYTPHTASVRRDPGAPGLGGSDHAALRAEFCVP